eukprot:scaffold162882_cov24-Tisochrysis_lutea.AAC.1
MASHPPYGGIRSRHRDSKIAFSPDGLPSRPRPDLTARAQGSGGARLSPLQWPITDTVAIEPKTGRGFTRRSGGCRFLDKTGSLWSKNEPSGSDVYSRGPSWETR